MFKTYRLDPKDEILNIHLSVLDQTKIVLIRKKNCNVKLNTKLQSFNGIFHILE